MKRKTMLVSDSVLSYAILLIVHLLLVYWQNQR